LGTFVNLASPKRKGRVVTGKKCVPKVRQTFRSAWPFWQTGKVCPTKLADRKVCPTKSPRKGLVRSCREVGKIPSCNTASCELQLNAAFPEGQFGVAAQDARRASL
jgi:hypothetical protein